MVTVNEDLLKLDDLRAVTSLTSAAGSSAVTVTIERGGREVEDVDLFFVTVTVSGSLLSSVVIGASTSTVVVMVTVLGCRLSKALQALSTLF